MNLLLGEPRNPCYSFYSLERHETRVNSVVVEFSIPRGTFVQLNS